MVPVLPNGDLGYHSGLPGQGGEPSEKFFVNHQFVRYTKQGDGTVLYLTRN